MIYLLSDSWPGTGRDGETRPHVRSNGYRLHGSRSRSAVRSGARPS